MPPITVILHTRNDAVRLGRALQTLHPCDEVLVIDHGSSDGTLRVARDYGARILNAVSGQSPGDHLAAALCDWVFYLRPSEALSEGLEASLFEWKLREQNEVSGIAACAVAVREEAASGWAECAHSTRLVPKGWNSWSGDLPGDDPRSLLLPGDLLRFRRP
jgi:glycosyltransferase involved in cell wall biosynthesis